MKSVATVIGVLIAASLVHAQPGGIGPAPVFKTVESVNKEKGVIQFREVVLSAVPVVKEIVVNENGVQVKKTVTVYETVAEQRMVEINAANSRFITPDGKQLPIDEVWKRIKAKSVVVFSGNSETPSQPYLRALSSDAVVIIPGMQKPQDK